MRNKTALALACSLCLPVMTAQAQGSVYRCSDAEGKVSFQGQPCPSAAPRQGGESPRAGTALPAKAAGQAQPAAPPLRVVEATNTKPEVMRWGAEADVIVVAAYEFMADVTQVHITHSDRPVLLILTSNDRTQWKVLPAPGTKIKAIVVSDSAGASKVQAPPGIPIVVDQLPYAYDTGNIKFRELMAKLNARYGVERVLGYRGGYKLPEVVPVSGPYVPDPNLTMDGIRPEIPRTLFSFDLISTDGRRLPFTNTGPKDGKRYTGIVRGGTLGTHRTGGPAAVRQDGSEAYYFEGNGGTLVWAPKGLGGPTQKVALPANLPELSWGSGIAWDTKKDVLAIVSFGGEGYFYRYDTRSRQWLGARSLKDRDLQSLAFDAETGSYVALSNKAELVVFNERGELEEVQPLEKLLRDLDSTYDKGNGPMENLTVIASGGVVAVVNVRKGTVTHIWTYEQSSRKAQLTYKAVE